MSDPAATGARGAELRLWRSAAPWLAGCALLLVVVMRAHTLGAGPALWPYTDAVEYASMATWMARGEGPWLRIGPAFFPARVPPTVSVLLLPQALAGGADATRYHLTILALGLAALLAFWRVGVALGLAPRAALAATALLALSPGFACYSGVVMSDVPALLFLLLALLAAKRALDSGREARASLLAAGLLGAVFVCFRATHAIWPAALGLLLWLGPQRAAFRPRWLAAALLAALLPIALLLFQQWIAYGAPWRTGYDFWQAPPRLDALHLFSAEGRRSGLYYLGELLGTRSDITNTRLGAKSDLHTLPAALLGLCGLTWLLRRTPRDAAAGLLLRGALLASVATLALVLCISNPQYREWRLLLPWTLLGAWGGGFALGRLAERRDLASRVAAPALGLAILWAALQPLPTPGQRLLDWREGVRRERAAAPAADAAAGADETAGDAPPAGAAAVTAHGAVLRETRLPLAATALLTPEGVVTLPARGGAVLPDYHLGMIRRHRLAPLRIDPGLEPLWHWLAQPPRRRR